MSEQHQRIAREAEVAAAVVFGVSVQGQIRAGRRRPAATMARCAAVAAAKDLGLSWSDMVAAFSAVRGEHQSLSSLRRQRSEWLSESQGASSWASAMVDLYDRILRLVRLRAGSAPSPSFSLRNLLDTA